MLELQSKSSFESCSFIAGIPGMQRTTQGGAVVQELNTCTLEPVRFLPNFFHALDTLPQASYLISLCISLIICKLGMIVSPCQRIASALMGIFLILFLCHRVGYSYIYRGKTFFPPISLIDSHNFGDCGKLHYCCLLLVLSLNG